MMSPYYKCRPNTGARRLGKARDANVSGPEKA